MQDAVKARGNALKNDEFACFYSDFVKFAYPFSKEGKIRTIGVWRSWLAHLHGVQGVVSSSLITPTTIKRNILNIWMLRFIFYIFSPHFPHLSLNFSNLVLLSAIFKDHFSELLKFNFHLIQWSVPDTFQEQVTKTIVYGWDGIIV